MPTLLRSLFSDEVLRQLVGFNTLPLCHGLCQGMATMRPGERLGGPICQETLAKNTVTLNVWRLEVLSHGAIRALAKTEVFGAQVSGMMDGTDAETTTRSAGCGQATRKVRDGDKRGRVHATEVSVYGWKGILLIGVPTKIPLTAKAAPKETSH